MSHKAEVIEVKELTDEDVAYKVRCCGDKSTDSWHSAKITADHTASLDAHTQRVAELHAAKQQWREKHGKPQKAN